MLFKVVVNSSERIDLGSRGTFYPAVESEQTPETKKGVLGFYVYKGWGFYPIHLVLKKDGKSASLKTTPDTHVVSVGAPSALRTMSKSLKEILKRDFNLSI
ncbi:MAG: hypothetical protein N2Z84_03430 [Atribacterota bacterium]|nr:hypothetical protein [Atribacterota bacterium]